MIKVMGEQVNTTLFPDGTSQVWKLSEEVLTCPDTVVVEWTFQNEGEFMQLAQLKALLAHHKVKAMLRLPYLPYARQDKPLANDATFSLHVFANFLNVLHFDTVECMDPHSAEARKLIKNMIQLFPGEEVHATIKMTEADVLCYPDKGACRKYMTRYQFPFVYGDKVRNPQTGDIESYKLEGDVKDKTVLIVDDICDGGATFTILAKQLYDAGAKNVSLFVTHGIFSKGLRPLWNAGIYKIFTKDGTVEARPSFPTDITYKPFKENV